MSFQTEPGDGDARARRRQIRRVLLLILLLNWLVCAAKLLIAWMSKSLSVQADAYHSFLDGASNIVGLIAITMASQAPDRDHPYGHRKFEVLGALAIGMLLAVASYNIIEEAIHRLRSGGSPQADTIAFVVMGVTILVNILITRYERSMGRELRSEILTADASHTQTDVWASIAVIVSLVCARYGFAIADVVVSLLIAGLIARAAWGIASTGAGVLSDRSVLDPEAVARAAMEVAGVQDCHEVRTRGTMDAIFADLRIHVDGALPLGQAHDLGHRVEDHLKKAFPGLRDVVIHLEPHDAHDP